MKLTWSEQALNDRDAIYVHIDQDGPAAALRLDRLFEARAAQLAIFPMSGRRGRVEPTRELRVDRNYVLVYLLRDDDVLILRVLHAARQWPPAPLTATSST